MKKVFQCVASAGVITIEKYGDGNGTKMVIKAEGGQFDCGKAEITEDGFELAIIGEYEIKELSDALFRFNHGDLWVEEVGS